MSATYAPSRLTMPEKLILMYGLMDSLKADWQDAVFAKLQRCAEAFQQGCLLPRGYADPNADDPDKCDPFSDVAMNILEHELSALRRIAPPSSAYYDPAARPDRLLALIPEAGRDAAMDLFASAARKAPALPADAVKLVNADLLDRMAKSHDFGNEKKATVLQGVAAALDANPAEALAYAEHVLENGRAATR